MKKGLTQINVKKQDKEAFKKLWLEWMQLTGIPMTQLEVFELMLLLCKTMPNDRISAMYHATRTGDADGKSEENC